MPIPFPWQGKVRIVRDADGNRELSLHNHLLKTCQPDPRSEPREVSMIRPKNPCDEALRRWWLRLRDDFTKLNEAKACAYFAVELELISEEQCDAWIAAFKSCPGHGLDDASRSWCAYCGNLKPEPSEAPDSFEEGKR